MNREEQLPIIEEIESALVTNDYNLISYYLRRRNHFTTFPPLNLSSKDQVQVTSVDFRNAEVNSSPEGGYCYSASVFINCNNKCATIPEEERTIGFYADLFGYFTKDGQLCRSQYPHSFFVLPPKIGIIGQRTIRMYFDKEMDIKIPKVCCCYEDAFTSYYRSKVFSLNGHVFGKVVTSSHVCQIIKNNIDLESPVIKWMIANEVFIQENWNRCIAQQRPLSEGERVNK